MDTSCRLCDFSLQPTTICQQKRWRDIAVLKTTNKKKQKQQQQPKKKAYTSHNEWTWRHFRNSLSLQTQLGVEKQIANFLKPNGESTSDDKFTDTKKKLIKPPFKHKIKSVTSFSLTSKSRVTSGDSTNHIDKLQSLFRERKRAVFFLHNYKRFQWRRRIGSHSRAPHWITRHSWKRRILTPVTPLWKREEKTASESRIFALYILAEATNKTLEVTSKCVWRWSNTVKKTRSFLAPYKHNTRPNEKHKYYPICEYQKRKM